LKKEERKDEVTKVNEEEISNKEDDDDDGGEKYTEKVIRKSSSSFYHSPSVLSILLFIFLPSCPLPHTCQLCLPTLSKLEFFSLALRKIA
jgi:hypothetical protein